MDNPLFGSVFSPSPTQDKVHNPVWSPAAADASRNPASARGMRRLSALQPWELGTQAGEGVSVDQALQRAWAAAPPAPGAAAAAGDRDRLEELEFAEIVGRTMRGELDGAEAVEVYAAACRSRAAELRDLATSQLQRAPRFMALSEAAAELEAEAATWRLLWFLHGIPSPDFPAGRGGDFVEGAGFAKTFRQHAADLLYKDATLNRAARSVAWLEALAAEADPVPELGSAPNDGVWRETRARLGAGPAARALAARDAGAAAMVTELDPDAPTRQCRRLDPDNAKDEERLMAMLWVHAFSRICEHRQHLLAVADGCRRLVRGGRVSRARGVCEYVGQPWRAASLAGGGAQGPLPLAAAAEEADAVHPSSDQAEGLAAEVDGGGGALRALWRWACYQAAERGGAAAEAAGRGAHEAALYGALSSHVGRILPVCSTWEDAAWAYLRCWLDCAVDAELGQEADDPGAALPADALTAGLEDSSAAVASEGLSVLQGGWPLPRVQEALPHTFVEAVEAAGAVHGAASGEGGGAARYRRVQVDLILDRVEGLVNSALVRWIIDGTGAGAGASGSVAGGADGPACPPGLMRFAAHLALALWSLGVAQVPEEGAPAAAYSHLHDLLQRLVQVYAVHLIDSGAHSLVPTYACHLRSSLRRATYLLFMEQLAALEDMPACRAAYLAGADWFGEWQRGDMAPDEMAVIARKGLGKAQMEATGGPLQRAQALRWLCFDAATHIDAVRWANALCREFALGGAGGAAAAAAMLFGVIPAAVGEGGLEALMRSAADLGAAAEAAELRCWALYFELETEFSSWEEVYLSARRDVEASGGDPFEGALAELAQQTLVLLEAAVGFLKEGCMAWLVVEVGEGTSAATAGEVAIVVGPEEGPNASPAVLSGSEYPTFASPEDRAAAATALLAALQATAAAHGVEGLAFHAGAAPEESTVLLPGLMSVAVDCGVGDESAQAAAVTLLSLALKGALPPAHSEGASEALAGPFVVTNLCALPAVSAALCRAVCTPLVALRAAALRQAAAEMGHAGEDGGEVVELAAGADMAPLFSRQELRVLLQAERATQLLHMRAHEVAQQRRQQQEDEQGGGGEQE